MKFFPVRSFCYFIGLFALAISAGAGENIPDQDWARIRAVYSGAGMGQQAYLKLAAPFAGDDFGYSVAVSGNTMVVGVPSQGSGRRNPYEQNTSHPGDFGGVDVFTRVEGEWKLDASLRPSSIVATSTLGNFGRSVAIDGDTIIVGAPNEKVPALQTRFGGMTPPRYGAAYIFRRIDGYWSQQVRLESDYPAREELFGENVAISGDIAVVGARNEATTVSGGAFVFKRSSDSWTRQALLKPANAPAYGEFSGSLAISGSTIIVGAPGEPGSQGFSEVGAAYLFTLSGNSWSQQARLVPPVATQEDRFGKAVGISGDFAVVGAPGPSHAAKEGAAYVFGRTGTSWTQKQKLAANNSGPGDWFGASVSISGGIIAVGAPLEDGSSAGINGQNNDGAVSAGSAHVFVNVGTNWRHQAYLKASNPGENDRFGWSISVSSDLVAAGALYEGGGNGGVNPSPDENQPYSGAAYAFGGFGPEAFKPEIAVDESGEEISNGGSRDFGQVEPGKSVTRTFVVRNRGTEPLKLSGTPAVAVSGKNAAAYKVTVLPAANVPAGGSTNFTVKFTPDGGGWKEALLSIPNNDPAGNPFTIRLEGRGITSSPLKIAQAAYIKASNTDSMDYFGYSVAVSGNTVVVGAPYESSKARAVNGLQSDNSSEASGATYVFVKTGNTWTQEAYLKADNASTYHTFGTGVAISGDTIAVSAPFQGQLAGPGGSSTLNYGAVFIFTRSGGKWTQQARLLAHNTQDEADNVDKFGAESGSIALSGNTLVVGARWEDSNAKGVNGNGSNDNSSDSGAAYVFVRSGSAWSQQAYLKASNSEAGDWFGYSVGISGNTIVVGSLLEAGNGGVETNNGLPGAGAAYVFTRSGSSWSQQAYLKAGNPGAGDNFGGSVAISGDVIIVGAPFEASGSRGINSVPNDSAVVAGAAYVFVRNGVKWTREAYLKASNADAGDYFGLSVAAGPNFVLVGAGGESSGGGTGAVNTNLNNLAQSGAAYAFQKLGGNWIQCGLLKAAQRGAKDRFGDFVAVSGETLVAGGYFEDSKTRGINTKPDEGAPDSGAIYIFDAGALAEADITVQQPAGTILQAGTSRKSFGTVRAGKSGAAKTFTIKNDGGADLTGLSVKMSGTNAKEFVVTQPAKKSLAPGASTTFKVVFKPSAKGTRQGTLKIASNDKDENPFALQLSGTGSK